ncbi:MAG: O-antigen ligase family protein [Patescibacteria group bacterium]|nr:O-antigen ligase family protein [Patescibacteria group bacterium]
MKLDKILRFISIGAVFLIPFIPLVVVSSLFFPYIVGKNILFRVLVELAFGAWAILALRDKKYRPRFSWILGSILIFVGVIFFADLLGENPLKSFWSNYERMEGWFTLLHSLGYFIVVISLLNSEKLWKRFLLTSVAVSVYTSFYGLSQLIESGGGTRLHASFGNASYLAIYLVIHIFLVAFFWNRRRKWNDFVGWFYASIILLHTIILYNTATRGAILGFIGSILLISFLIAFFEKEKKGLRKISAGILVGTLILVGSFISLKDSSFVRDSSVLSRFADISFQETTTKSRFMIWNMAWEGVKEKPLLGWGQENFNYVFNENYDPKMYGQEEWFDRTHNVFLDWLIAGGFLGLLSYLALFGAVLLYLWSRKRGSNFSLIEKSLFTGLLAGYFVHNLFVFDNITSYILFFTILGFIHNQISSSDQQEENERKGFLSRIDSENTLNIITIVIIILTLFSIHSFNTKFVLANRALLQAIAPHEEGLSENLNYYKKALSYNSYANQEIREQLMQFVVKIKGLDIDESLKKELFSLAVSEAGKEIERDPRNVRTEVFLGSLLSTYDDLDGGLLHLQKGLEISPEKQTIRFEIGSIYINKGQYGKAFEIFKETYELEPAYNKAKSAYVLSAIYAKKEDLIEETFGKSINDLDIIFDMNFVSAYNKSGEKLKAIEILKKIVEENPKEVQYRVSLAAAYFENGQNSKSIIELEKAIELDPNFKGQGEKFIEEVRLEM